jgi:hypothetical protein
MCLKKSKASANVFYLPKALMTFIENGIIKEKTNHKALL